MTTADDRTAGFVLDLQGDAYTSARAEIGTDRPDYPRSTDERVDACDMLVSFHLWRLVEELSDGRTDTLADRLHACIGAFDGFYEGDTGNSYCEMDNIRPSRWPESFARRPDGRPRIHTGRTRRKAIRAARRAA